MSANCLFTAKHTFTQEVIKALLLRKQCPQIIHITRCSVWASKQEQQLGDCQESGRNLTRFGRAFSWSFLISTASTLQYSNDKDRKFFKGFKYCNPSFVTPEFDIFKDTSPVSPDAFPRNFRYNFWKKKKNPIFIQTLDN